jgi:hypothetical protein
LRKKAAAGLVLILLAGSPAARASTLTRDLDPVVLTGQALSDLTGLAVDRLVGFRWVSGWVQIPVQIDERDIVDFDAIYGDPDLFVGVTTLAYTDPNTYTGPDTVPGFDSDDEIAFMAADAGNQAPQTVALPAGVVAGSGVEVGISDPIDSGRGWVYLFETDGTLDPSAGASYGTYTFNLLAGSYIPNYNIMTGPNPENSSFGSDLYQTHFSDRWIRDELNVLAGAATGVDILDRHKSMFGPGQCGRTEDTFSGIPGSAGEGIGEGAFVVNKDGAIRSIRSYLGANSGPLTQREHVFYRGRQDVITYLRVHGIPGVMDAYDYSSDAIGMTYYNSLNTGGVTVDGSPDVVTAGELEWEMVSGAQGAITIVHTLDTTTGLVPTSYYSDDSTPSVTQCTGDAQEYATSGPWFTDPIPNTDPLGPTPATFVATRTVYYDPPGAGVPVAEARSAQATSALLLTASPFPSVSVPTLRKPALLALGLGFLTLGTAFAGRRDV